MNMGEVPEWLNGTVSKTVVELVSTVGSNPTLSAACKQALLQMERGFSYFLLLFKKIVFLFLTKVDGQVSRVNRDKCPVHSECKKISLTQM